MEKIVYLDNASTTKTDDGIASKIAETLCSNYGNPSSLHSMGIEAGKIIKQATEKINKSLGGKKGRLYFTSGGTEANNLAIFGAVKVRARNGKTVVTSTTEHSSVTDSFKELSKQGYNVLTVAPKDGIIQKEDILNTITEDTILASFILVNNETGAILSAEGLVSAIKRKAPNCLVHIDAVGAVGKERVNLSKLSADYVSFSGHKIYAPKGIGAFWVKEGVRILPCLFGGEQQEKIRPGTENVAYIEALGTATELAISSFDENYNNTLQLNNYLKEKLKALDFININSEENASPYILNFSVDGIRSETLLHFLADKGVYISSGSACKKGESSHVLKSLGLDNDRVDSAVRVSFGKHNVLEDVDILVDGIVEARQRLKLKKR